MSFSADQFRDVLRCFAAGVTVMTANRAGRIHGLTVSAFVSVSADPPLVAAVIHRDHGVHSLLEVGGASFAVNILSQEQTELSERFAFAPEDERFDGVAWTTAETGAPILTDALAWLDCRIEDRHLAGSHVIYVARVLAGEECRSGAGPLIYWDRAYRRIETRDPT